MLDCQLYGLNPAGHHFTNVLFHIANTVLLFLFLSRTTGTTWRSGFVAALFACHPLHVESVAWVAERKDVLSTFFWLLTLLAYARHVTSEKWQVVQTVGTSSPVTCHLSPSYFLALFFFACGLMSKPMVVTLPFVMLLLDFWPLNRFSLNSAQRAKSFGNLILEKVPFLVLSLASSVITFLVQRAGGAVSSLDTVPLSFRITNAAVSYLRYVSKAFWPVDLAVLYPIPRIGHWDWSLFRPVLFWRVRLVCLACPTPSLFVCRLVLVFGHVDTGDRPGPSRFAVHSGSLYVHSQHWPVHCGNMGFQRAPGRLATKKVVCFRHWNYRAGRLHGGYLDTIEILAK